MQGWTQKFMNRAAKETIQIKIDYRNVLSFILRDNNLQNTILKPAK